MNNQLAWRILKHFSMQNTLGFKRKHVKTAFPDKDPSHLSRILKEMVDMGLLLKITRNLYHIIPFNADPESYAPNKYQLVKYLAQNKVYYIGYASALEYHGLKLKIGIKASEGIEYVVTSQPERPAKRVFYGNTYSFITHNEHRFFGFKSMWVNQVEKVMVSDPEKTIVDIASKPQCCGGIINVAYAIFQTKDKLDPYKLFFYFAKNRNKSAKKRFLFLTDLLGMNWTAEHEKMLNEIGMGYSLLDPFSSDPGIGHSRFGLKVNVDPSLIRNTIHHQQISTN